MCCLFATNGMFECVSVVSYEHLKFDLSLSLNHYLHTSSSKPSQTNPHVTTCKPIRHAFCHECIVSCLNVSSQCPVCRAKLKVKDLQCADFIDEDEDSKEADNNEDTASIDDGNEENADDKKKKKKNDKYIEDIPFKSKFNRLLEELKTIRDNEPEVNIRLKYGSKCSHNNISHD